MTSGGNNFNYFLETTDQTDTQTEYRHYCIDTQYWHSPRHMAQFTLHLLNVLMIP